MRKWSCGSGHAEVVTAANSLALTRSAGEFAAVLIIHPLSEEASHERESFPEAPGRPVRFYPDRAAGCDRHYRDSDRPVGAGGAKSARSRRAHAVHEQPQAD